MKKSFNLHLFILLLSFSCSHQKRDPSSKLFKKNKSLKNQKIAIIGAGASGIGAAAFLKRKGYENITLYEKEPQVGGKGFSVNINGKNYELGTLWIGSNYRAFKKIAKPTGIKIIKDDIPMIVFDQEKDEFKNFNRHRDKRYSFWQFSGAAIRLGKVLLGKKKYFKVGNKKFDPEMAIPSYQFNEKYRLNAALEQFRLFMVLCGYGFFDEVPTLYNLRIIDRFYAQGAVLRAQSLIFNNPYMHKLKKPDQNYRDTWQKIIDHYQLNLKLNQEVVNVRPLTGEGVEIETQNGSKEIYDKVIMATPPQVVAKVVNYQPMIHELFNRFEHVNYLVSVVKVDEWKQKAGHIFLQNIRNKEYNSLLAIYNPYGNIPLYTTYQILKDPHQIKDANEKIKQGIEEIGGKFNSVVQQKLWKYFYHLPQKALEDKTYQLIEQLQGVDGIYYTGSYMNFETVESSVKYSKYLVKKHF